MPSFNPMPGTSLWDECQNKGYLRRGFSLDNVRVECANIDTPGMPAEALERLVAREEVRGRIRALVRHPLRISRKYLQYIRKDRRVVRNFLMKNIRGAFGSRGGRGAR